jgi:hypothetical protein
MVFRSRRLGPTDLTWEEKNSANYLFDANNHRKSQGFTKDKEEHKPRETLRGNKQPPKAKDRK